MSIKAVIFDMDGTLIDSESIWKQAGVDLFQSFNIPVNLQDMQDLTGFPAITLVESLYKKYNVAPLPVLEMAQRYNTYAIDLVLEKKPLMAGVQETLQLLQNLGIKMAIASASPKKLLVEITQRCEISQYFTYLSSAVELNYNKPHPEVYLQAAKMLNVNAQDCIGIEDSIIGMTSVKAASMKCIVVPDSAERDDPRYSLADVKLNKLTEINEELILKLGK